MIRHDWRKSLILATGIGATAVLLFATIAPRVNASGHLMESVRRGISRIAPGLGRHAGQGPVIEGRSARLIGEEAKAKAKDSRLVRYGGVDFDPKVGVKLPDGVPTELVAPARVLPAGMDDDGTDYWILQYRESGDDLKVQEMVEAAGGRVVSYVPNLSYLVRVTDAQIPALQSSSLVRWLGRALPAFKLTPAALDLIQAGGDSSQLPLDDLGLVRLEIGLHPGLDDAALAQYIGAAKALPGVQIISVQAQDNPSGRGFMLGVDPSVLNATLVRLASLRDVRLVDFYETPHVDNDHAIWFMQTGQDQVQATDYSISGYLFFKGLTGRGLIGSVADTGLENDMCFFRYGPEQQEADWPIGPSGDAPVPVPPEGGDIDLTDNVTPPPLRTRYRKTVAYYLEAGATVYSSPIQHGTGVSGCMLGDAWQVLAARPLIRDLGIDQNVRPWSPTGTWTLGQELRADLIGRVDNPTIDDPLFPDTYGNRVQHHQSRDGQAPGAQLIMQDIGNAANALTSTVPTYNLLTQAGLSGATVENFSFGGNPCIDCYTGPARDADTALWLLRDLVLTVSAGNEGLNGPGSIDSGAQQGKSPLVVGWSIAANVPSCAGQPCIPWSTTRLGQSLDPQSSKGPKSGGLLAPDIVATGTVVTAADENTPLSPEDGTGSGSPVCEATPGQVGGTSFASPTAGGAALLVQQYFMDGYYPSGVPTPSDALRPTNALVRAVMVNSARDMLGARTSEDNDQQAHRPSNGQGWGAPRLDDTLFFAGDPKLGNPEFETERARFLVATDTPGGFDSGMTLTPEPGGKTRDQIVGSFHTALETNGLHEYFVDVINDTDGDTIPDLTDLANELRVTLAWTDFPGASVAAPVVNDLDLEVVSPGPNGVLETSNGNVRGDDVVYRPDPLTAWANGYSIPSPDAEISSPPYTGLNDWPDRDPLNSIENVFIPPQDVVAGTWILRVLGRNVPGGGGGSSDARPNFALNDQPPSRDTNGDTVPDVDEKDTILARKQGYALVLSGNFTTTQGIIAINQSNFGCTGERLQIALNDQNGSAFDPPCTSALTATLTTTTPSPSFPSDNELVEFVGTQPTFHSRNPVTGGGDFVVQIVNDAADVIHGDGVIQVAHGEAILAEYVDNKPCGGRAFAQASVSCQPAVTDQGFIIADGCDYAEPGNPASGTRPDAFMDVGETNRYQVFFTNNGGEAMNDCVVSLYPDPANPLSQGIEVLNSPQHVGLAPPGRISDATFLVHVNAAPPRSQLDFIIEVSSPLDGMLFPVSFTQRQVLEADTLSFHFNTRDPNGELFAKNRIEVLKEGVVAIPGGNPASDYITNEPIWFDPDVTPAYCNEPRDLWTDRDTPPLDCDTYFNGNPYDPWDFDEDDEGFKEFPHEGDEVLTAGINAGPLFDYKSSLNNGGGCGWEDQLRNQLLGDLPANHPDIVNQPWGIWHTGPINTTTSGPFPGTPPSNGPPFLDDPTSPQDHTIYWDSTPVGGNNNTTGQWCKTYLSNPNLAPTDHFYRAILLAPRLHRVHLSNPEYRVEFQELLFYNRIDGHNVNNDGNNSDLLAFDWLIDNQPIDPVVAVPPQYSWSQWREQTHIVTDSVNERWDVDDNTLQINLHHPNTTFTFLTFEDIYGPAADAWNFALGVTHLHTSGRRSHNEYGVGLDDMAFSWTESRDDDDTSDCNALPDGQRPIIAFDANRYNACNGVAKITLIAPPSETRDPVCVAVTSAAEDFESAVLHYNNFTQWYEGEIAFTTDTNNNAVGVLLVSSGVADSRIGADDIKVEYDPDGDLGLPDHSDADCALATAEDRADWQDLDNNGINDDDHTNSTPGAGPPDGIPDAEDDPLGEREAVDFATINCTSGRLFYIKHALTQQGPGDGDRYADPGERQRMQITLVSGLGTDLIDADVRISTNDPICLINDTVHVDTIPGNETLVDVDGFEFAVPLGLQSTAGQPPRTITFRVDVAGTNTANLNAFSTAGDSFNTFLPMEALLYVDVDSPRNSTADFIDTAPQPQPPQGTFFEGFNNAPLFAGLDHQLQVAFFPGLRALLNDTTGDTRYGMAGNSGFCPECDVQDDCSVINGNCDYYFASPDNTTFTPGYPMAPDEWSWTDEWAKEGTGSYKFGKPDAGPNVPEQHYTKGQYISLELPPLRIASTAANPELSFWQIAEFWTPNFTGGLFTPIDGAVIEISATNVGTPDSGVPGNPDNVQRSIPSVPADPTSPYPGHGLSSFRRLSPYSGLYDFETDALNACRTLYCGFKHPVFASRGSVDETLGGGNPEAGIPGTPGRWKFSKINLSDYRGMEVVVRFSAEVLQDLEIPNGNLGWFLDAIQMTGVSNRVDMVAQATNLQTEPCGIVADFAADDPACFGEDVQFLDRHEGVGQFDVSQNPSQPYPLDFEWTIGGWTRRGAAGATFVPEAGVWGTYDNPRINFSDVPLTGVTGPGNVTVRLRIYQNGAMVDEITKTVLYKDAPVPVIDPISAAYVGGTTTFSAHATFDANLDPDRTLYWEWDFGDGSGADASGPVVTHTYANLGTYDVTVRVYDEDGCSSSATPLSLTVTASPTFGNPAITLPADPDCGNPFGADNNPDIEEVVTFNLTVQNTSLVNATGVVGYLSSTDDLVEIVDGAWSFGTIGPGLRSTPGTFRFIRHDDGSGIAPSCMVLPFTLTLVSNNRSVSQDLSLAFTMGAATFASFDNVGTQTGNFCLNGAGNGNIEFPYTSAAGCLTGLALDMDVRGVGQGSVNKLQVLIIPPDSSPVVIMYEGDGDGPGGRNPWPIHFRFGADNAQGPIPDTAGQLVDLAGTLSPTVAADLVSTLSGRSLVGAAPWKVKVLCTLTGSAPSCPVVTIREFQLEGINSADLEVGQPAACSCITASAPVFGGVHAECVGGTSRVEFSPAVDTSECNGVSDVTYQLYASTTPGQLGQRIDNDANRLLTVGETCSGVALCSDGRCAHEHPVPNATYWDVCDAIGVYWTVIAVDAGGARTPNISNSSDVVPAGYQTASTSCILPILPGVHGIVRDGAGASATMTLWLIPPPGRVGSDTWNLYPPPGASEYRVLRGTFTDVAPADGYLNMLSQRTPWNNHTGTICSMSTTSRDITPDLTTPGSFYYLVVGVNAGGCAGMGYDQTQNQVNPSGPLVQGNPIPGLNTGCNPFPDCFSP